MDQKVKILVCALLTIYSFGFAGDKVFFREDWKEIPAEVPVSQKHVVSSDLILTKYGSAKDSLKKSFHENLPNDPYYIWSGLCKQGRWAITLHKKETLVDLSKGIIRLRCKQQGPNVLKFILGLSDGSWLVSEKGFGETPDWHVFSVGMNILTWRKLDMEKIKAGEQVEQPDLREVKYIGWTDLMTGNGSTGCTRVDWIEVIGY